MCTMSESDKCYEEKYHKKGEHFTSNLSPNSDGFTFEIYSETNHFHHFHYSAQAASVSRAE